ncbi:unnamed protein product, partial [Soboliphyme baturini]|uniref:HEAT repeat-containing protein 1 n=1 Tax=Soboliphyme baturini TaxID=241478 RepID=A0A183J948_9BILA
QDIVVFASEEEHDSFADADCPSTDRFSKFVQCVVVDTMSRITLNAHLIVFKSLCSVDGTLCQDLLPLLLELAVQSQADVNYFTSSANEFLLDVLNSVEDSTEVAKKFILLMTTIYRRLQEGEQR